MMKKSKCTPGVSSDPINNGVSPASAPHGEYGAKHGLLAFSLTLLLASCGGATGPSPSPLPDDPQPAPNIVQGQVLTSQGQPVANAVVHVKPVSFDGLITARTDAQGRFKTTQLNEAVAPYKAQAYKELDYHGKQYCVRMGGEDASVFDGFNPKLGVTLNFRWKLTGRAEGGMDDTTWGADLKFYAESDVPASQRVDWSDTIELTLVPDGPLLDGSQGTTITRAGRADSIFRDIPVGKYRISAKLVNSDGSRTALQIGSQTVFQTIPYGQEVSFLFEGLSRCGHYATFHVTSLALKR